MKTNSFAIIITSVCSVIYSGALFSQKTVSIENYLEGLPKELRLDERSPQKYVMMAEYFNKDIYGNLSGKVKITGEYTRGLEDGYACWNNVFVSHSDNQSESYQDSVKQEYMENITYNQSSELLEESFFESFPDHTDNIFARNLIWDMMTIEGFAWDYFDLLQLNKTYIVPDFKGSVNMAEVGSYDHGKVELDWIGISMMNDKLCAVIEYRALDNKLDLQMDFMKSKGSELYWGKTWLSLENKQIEYAEMYSNTILEMEIPGLPDKMMTNTKRVLKLERAK